MDKGSESDRPERPEDGRFPLPQDQIRVRDLDVSGINLIAPVVDIDDVEGSVRAAGGRVAATGVDTAHGEWQEACERRERDRALGAPALIPSPRRRRLRSVATFTRTVLPVVPGYQTV